MTNKMLAITEISIDDITINARARKDLGDLTSLTNSILESGLLNPILITQDNILIAGERRLCACKALQHEKILARVMPDLLPDELMIIERMENLARKEFLWHEELELRYALHTLWKKGNKSWSIRLTAEKLKCSAGGLSSDLLLAENLINFPHLKDYDTKTKARDSFKKLIDSVKASNAIKSLPKEDQEKLEELRKGNIPEIQKPKLHNREKYKKKKSKPIIPKATHPDEVPDTTDMRDPSQREQNTVTESKKKPPEVIYAIESYETFIPKVPDNTVGLVELDPPYAINFNENYKKETEKNDTDWTADQLYEFYENMLPVIYDKMLDNSWAICWTGKEHWLVTNEIASSAGFEIQYPGIWSKTGGSSNTPKTTMISTYEMFLLFRKGKPMFNVPSVPAVWNFDAVSNSNKTHQWEKPLKMYNYIMNIMARPKAFFLSPFAGSGNSMIAAALADMLPLGCDESESCIYSFHQRLNNFYLKE